MKRPMYAMGAAGITLATWCSLASLVVHAQESVSTVNIQLVDEAGAPIPCSVDSFADRYRRREMASHFAGLVGTAIPYGEYTLYLRREASDGGVGIVSGGTVSVKSQEHLFVVSSKRWFFIHVAIERYYSDRIRGKLLPMPKDVPKGEPLWIRLSPVHGSKQLDAGVDPSGEFRIFEPLEGKYLLTVIRGPDVLHTELVSFDENWGPAEFTVRMPANPPPVFHITKSN